MFEHPDPPPGYATDASAIFFSCRQPGFIEFDIKPIVQSWVSGAADHGVMLRATDERISGKSPRFVSDEGPEDQRPYLIVEC